MRETVPFIQDVTQTLLVSACFQKICGDPAVHPLPDNVRVWHPRRSDTQIPRPRPRDAPWTSLEIMTHFPKNGIEHYVKILMFNKKTLRPKVLPDGLMLTPKLSQVPNFFEFPTYLYIQHLIYSHQLNQTKTLAAA